MRPGSIDGGVRRHFTMAVACSLAFLIVASLATSARTDDKPSKGGAKSDSAKPGKSKPGSGSKAGDATKAAPAEASASGETPKSEPSPEGSDDDEPTAKVTAGKKWVQLVKVSPQAPVIPKALEDESLVTAFKGLSLTGVKPDDDVLLGTFKSDGDWGISRAGMLPMSKNAALLVAKADGFELEGEMSAEGLGGWFFLVGLKEGHGYLLYNVTLKTSGSPWIVSELRDGRCLEGTHAEVVRHVWKGYQPFRLQVEKKRLQLLVGKDHVVKDLDLDNYHEGEVVVGAYDGKYGPKPLRIRSMRVRAR